MYQHNADYWKEAERANSGGTVRPGRPVVEECAPRFAHGHQRVHLFCRAVALPAWSPTRDSLQVQPEVRAPPLLCYGCGPSPDKLKQRSKQRE